MNIITGEKIQNLCDIYLCSRNKAYGIKPSKVVYIDTITDKYNNPKKIFIFTDLIYHYFNYLVKILQFFQNDFCLVIHNSDYNFTNQYISIFTYVPKLKRIYTQNMDIIHPYVVPIPIGLANSRWEHGNLEIVLETINKIEKKEIIKNNNIYFQFSINTAKQIREDCYNKIIKKDIPFTEALKFDKYIPTLATYKFAISPEGNGIDTHRLWECLYLKVIPITKRNRIVEYYCYYFPIIILDDWDNLNISELDKIYNNADWSNYNKLDLKYIQNMIINHNTIL
jgi:hypothetical protein